jgi:uncharacterized protein YndB with AHSA1/START domain
MTETSTSVRVSVVVAAPPEEAFKVFTEDMASWWAPDHHLMQAPLASMVLEPKVGGSVYDVGTDGSECHWGTVLAYDPPERVAFSWNISLQWQLETDPSRVSEVEVRFVPEGEDATRVELEHRHLDRHGEGWEGMREAVGSSGGWIVGLERLARRLAGEPVDG